MKRNICYKLKKNIYFLFFLLLGNMNNSCSDYLDIVPDNIATIEMAFSMRSEAIKYLFNCYSFLPKTGNLEEEPSIMAGDEIWSIIDSNRSAYSDAMFRIARGFQNANEPIANGYWRNLYRGLRDCNIFLENVDNVPDLPDWEKTLWRAEVTFLKAYYHFYLVRMYGPIPLIKENLPIDASVDQVKVYRDPVDDCFNYIVELLDEAMPGLPLIIENPVADLGRITRPIAASVKAQVLVTAASPLFNGNPDQITLKNPNGVQLFPSQFDLSKWKRAAIACEDAIEVCHSAGMKLYEYNPNYQQYNLTDITKVQLSIRNAFCEKWNSEIIWANTNTGKSSIQQIQTLSSAGLDSRYLSTPMKSQLQPPIKIAKMFYTDNGVPIEEDMEWNGVDLLVLCKL